MKGDPVNLETALRLLPHGAEFRFVDRLHSLQPGEKGAGEYLVRGDEPFLRGHFPDAPIFPGVLLVEAAAQLAGIVAHSNPQIPALHNLKLTALRNVKILGAAIPGDTIIIEVTVIGRLGNLIQARATGRVGDKAILQLELTLSGTGLEASPAG